MRISAAAVGMLALFIGTFGMRESASGSAPARRGGASRQYHASFQGAVLSLTGGAGCTRSDGYLFINTSPTAGSSVSLRGTTAMTQFGLDREGATLTVHAWRNAGGSFGPDAHAYITAGGITGTTRHGFGFKWVGDAIHGVTFTSTGTESTVNLGVLGPRDLMATVTGATVDFYVDGVLAGSLPKVVFGTLSSIYEVYCSNGSFPASYGISVHALSISIPH